MRNKILLLAVSFLFGYVSLGYSLEKETHRAINQYISENAFNSFRLDTYLKSNLGFAKGKDQLINGQKIYELIRDGGKTEDEPAYTRSRNHFHDPLLPRDQAGLNSGIFTGLSSALWIQDQTNRRGTDLGGDWSWKKARQFYYAALSGNSMELDGYIVTESWFPSTIILGETNMNEAERNQFFAWTFRAVGQTMHLIEDASVPSHTRNDVHVKYNYEDYVEKFRNTNGSGFNVLLSTPILFSGTINNIASFIDTNQYNNPNPDPNVTYNSAIGLSEYTNANFFSEDTIFKDYPHPAYSDTTYPNIDWLYPEITDAEDGKFDSRIYIRKTVGDADPRLAALSYISRDCIQKGYYQFSPLVLDDNVYNDYAVMLLPRAVGYSAGLLDYFFRGNIEITLPDKGIYSGIDAQTASQGFKNIKLLAKNTTPNNEEMTNGSIELVVIYRRALEDPFINYPETYPFQAENFFRYIVVPEANPNIRSIPRDNPVELTFDLTGNPIPLWAIDVNLQLVYRGKLGNENDAVVVGLKDISEPTPVDFNNDMDKICLNENETLFEAGSPEAIAQVDAPENGGNNNGIADEWDVYAHDVRDIYIRFSPEGVQRYASPDEYDFRINGTIAAGEFMRAFYILTDYTHNYNVYSSWIKKDPYDPWIHPPSTSAIWPGKAIKNQTYYTDTEGYIWRYPTFLEYRDKLIWWGGGLMYINRAYPAGSECSCYRGILRTCPAQGATSSFAETLSTKGEFIQDDTSRIQSPSDFQEGTIGSMSPISQ